MRLVIGLHLRQPPRVRQEDKKNRVIRSSMRLQDYLKIIGNFLSMNPHSVFAVISEHCAEVL